MSELATQGQTILLVDDYDDARQMYGEFLADAGYRVVEACDGAEAIAKAHETMPNAIVMDLSLPGIDGWEATRRLKGHPSTRHIPIVALTGYALERHLRAAIEAGCDGFLAKPCLPERLHETVRRMVAGGQASGIRKVPLPPWERGATGS